MQHSERFWIRSFLLPDSKKDRASRFAVAVSKKVSPTAVGRNAIKRRIYGLVEKLVSEKQPALGIIVGVKTKIMDIPLDQIEAELSVLLKKVLK